MTITSSSSRQLLLRLAEPARLPDAVLAALRDEVVLAGWLRGGGVLADVQIRALGAPRRIAGPVQAVVVDGALGFANGDVTCSLRAVLARETDSGLETIAGEIVDARIVSFEALVTALDDVAGAQPAARPPAPVAPPAPAPAPPPPVAAAPTLPKPSPGFGGPQPMPPRPMRPQAIEEDDQPYPEPGDLVEHFAFGRCEVVKSDGDRLHVRLGKDGRIKEIALEMLKVTPLAPVEGAAGRHYRLDRRM